MNKLKSLIKLFLFGNIFNIIAIFIYCLITKKSFLQLDEFLLILAAFEFLFAILCLSSPTDDLAYNRSKTMDKFVNTLATSGMPELNKGETSSLKVFKISGFMGLVSVMYFAIFNYLI